MKIWAEPKHDGVERNPALIEVKPKSSTLKPSLFWLVYQMEFCTKCPTYKISMRKINLRKAEEV
jgi:hypothetical protein